MLIKEEVLCMILVSKYEGNPLLTPKQIGDIFKVSEGRVKQAAAENEISFIIVDKRKTKRINAYDFNEEFGEEIRCQQE